MVNSSATFYPSGARKRSYSKPFKCGCGKVRHRSEQAALDVARTQAERHDMPFSAYRCPGFACWHTTSRGFQLSTLRTKNRIIAFYLWRDFEKGEVDRMFLERRFPPPSNPRTLSNAIRRELSKMANAGLISCDAGTGKVDALNPGGLLRVVVVGLDGYLQENGLVLPSPSRTADQDGSASC